MKHISVIGMGYIGFPTALLIANNNRNVKCVDIDNSKIENLKKGELFIKEKDIKKLFNRKKKYLSFSNNITRSDVYIICVPTPIKKKNKELFIADITIIKNVLKKISKIIKEKDLIIIESTCPPGFAESLYKKFFINKKIFLSTCPERAIPGSTLKEMIYNDRVIGSSSNEAFNKTLDIYNTFVKGKIFKTHITEAELVKLFENTYRDTNIALANELDLISKKYNLSSKKILKLSNLHPRVNIHNPGIGVGGHCIPVDPWFLLNKRNFKQTLIYKSRLVNLNKEKIVYKHLSKKIANSKKKKFLFFGITYKENTDDIRNSPALNIINKLKSRIRNLKIYDPFNKSLNNITSKEVKKINFDEIIVFVKHKWLSKNKLNSKKITYI